MRGDRDVSEPFLEPPFYEPVVHVLHTDHKMLLKPSEGFLEEPDI